MEEKIRKFSTFRIAEHALVMLTFPILAVTGLVQKFHELDISRYIINLSGGIDMLRLIHRNTGLFFCLQIAVHVLYGAVELYRGVEPKIMIRKKDFADAIHNLKYYLGFEPKPASTEIFTYRQKFEYWGILTGSIIMALTGLILRFPVLAAKLLPGILIPAAKLIHTNHALILALILLWHLYNSIFNPEVFPLNRSIFTGYVYRRKA
ncbi:MAG: cytochrome b/b6 domain-containing protein [Thermodesulfovibrionales bacterium]|nr:cytochrome b/b6 domain-containing protein [Thermodesulfovibrionales bacterium]